MIPFGKILNFRSYDVATTERMKNDLGLQAPLAFWQYCANHYREYAKRDPFIEELKTLDKLFLALQNLPSLISVQELYTNDEEVVKTYGDMMQKRKELSCDIGAQISLGELLSLADNYLLRGGKKLSQPHPLTFWEDADTLGVIPSYRDEKKSDDLFALLLPIPVEQEEATLSEEESTEDIPTEPAQEPDLKGLLANREFASEITMLKPIGVGGILLALLQEDSAFRIDLDALCSAEEPAFADLLTEAFRGDYLIRIPAATEEKASVLAKEYGYSIKSVAHADEGGSMTALQNKKELFQLETSFLKTLFSVRSIHAKMKDEKKGSLTPVSISLMPSLDDFGGVRIFCAPENAFFTNAIQTALSAVLLQCLNGTAYREQRLWLSLRIPKRLDDHTAGDLLSVIIGLYRLQAELGIPASSCAVYDEHISSPVLTVIACGRSETQSQDVQELSEALRKTEIPSKEDGSPDFDELRRLLTSLCQKDSVENAEDSGFTEQKTGKREKDSRFFHKKKKI